MRPVVKADDEFVDLEPLNLDDIEAITQYEAESIAVMTDEILTRFTDLRASTEAVEFYQAIVSGNVAGADIALSWQDLGDLAEVLEQVITDQIRAGGSLAADLIPESRLGVRYRFDASNPAAVNAARQRAARLIREITNEQRELVRQTIVEAVSGGYTVDDVAFIVEQSIGLHSRWQKAVRNQYGRTLSSLLESGVSLSRARRLAQAASVKYAERLTRARSRAIARTEILSAHNEGRWLAWEDAIVNGIAPTNAQKMWRVRVPQIPDSPCDYCLPFNGEVVPWDAEFSSGVMMPPLHPNCVCTATLVIPEDATYA